MDALALDDGVGEALRVEGVVVEFAHRLGVPQAQRVDVAGAVAGDGHVVGHGAHGQVVELHDARLVLAADDEGVALLHPRVRVLVLEAVLEGLLEQSVAVQDAVAGGGQVLGGAGIEEAGGEAAEAAVAQRGVVLGLEHVGEVLAVVRHGLLGLIDEAQVEEVVQQRPAHEELGGEVVLLPGAGVGAGGGLPVVGELIDDDAGQARPKLHLRRGLGRAAGFGADVRGEAIREIRHMVSDCVVVRVGRPPQQGVGAQDAGGIRLYPRNRWVSRWAMTPGVAGQGVPFACRRGAPRRPGSGPGAGALRRGVSGPGTVVLPGRAANRAASSGWRRRCRRCGRGARPRWAGTRGRRGGR